MDQPVQEVQFAAPAITSASFAVWLIDEETRGPEKAKSKVKNGAEGWGFNDKKGQGLRVLRV